MARKTHPQKPHYGIAHNLKRNGRSVGDKQFESIAKAKRFMRTGSASRDHS